MNIPQTNRFVISRWDTRQGRAHSGEVYPARPAVSKLGARIANSGAVESAAFTLIEMLVVIAIIGILAGLLLGVAPVAVAKMRISRAQVELASLSAAISYYQSKKGFYPPDNTTMTTQSPLFYELTGTLQTNKTATPSLLSQQTMEILASGPAGQTFTLFNLPGFMNYTADPTELNSLNYFPGVKAGQQYGSFYIAGNSGATFTLLGSQIPGPYTTSTVAKVTLNPWHYVSSSPTHNPNSFDLWLDISIRGQTNRISNWNKDPEPVSDFQK
jgi:prepilin-type N-terminal cleavage/methylation domain-containing protein